MIIEFVREDLSAARDLMRSAWGAAGKMNVTRLRLIEILGQVERFTEPGVVYQVDKTVLPHEAVTAFSWVVEASERRTRWPA